MPEVSKAVLQHFTKILKFKDVDGLKAIQELMVLKYLAIYGDHKSGNVSHSATKR